MDEVREAAEAILNSRYLVLFTGAGMSADSGIPVFRGGSGLWDKYSIEDLATPQGFMRNPELVWRWYLERYSKVKRVKPHRGYKILFKWFRNGILKTVITQNVDGLFRRVGFKDVIELHGRLDIARCMRCRYKVPMDDVDTSVLPPLCPNCYSYLRPDVVWFGEPLDPGIIKKAYEEAGKADTLLVIGTSGVVYPAAYIVDIAFEKGARIIDIDPSPPAFIDSVDIYIPLGAEEALIKIDGVVERLSKRYSK